MNISFHTVSEQRCRIAGRSGSFASCSGAAPDVPSSIREGLELQCWLDSLLAIDLPPCQTLLQTCLMGSLASRVVSLMVGHSKKCVLAPSIVTSFDAAHQVLGEKIRFAMDLPYSNTDIPILAKLSKVIADRLQGNYPIHDLQIWVGRK